MCVVCCVLVLICLLCVARCSFESFVVCCVLFDGVYWLLFVLGVWCCLCVFSLGAIWCVLCVDCCVLFVVCCSRCSSCAVCCFSLLLGRRLLLVVRGFVGYWLLFVGCSFSLLYVVS